MASSDDNQSYGDSSYYYDEDREYDDDDVLPLTTAELERREKKSGSALLPPAPLAVVEEYRSYLTNGGDPTMVGGFLQVMRLLGHTPKSNDPLTADEHNLWQLTLPGQDLDLNERWEEMAAEKRAELRLLRYGEYLETLQGKGLAPPDDWGFQDPPVPGGSGVSLDEEEEEEEDDLTEDQLEAYGSSILTSFILYVNEGAFDEVAIVPGGSKAAAINVSEDLLLEQCRKTEFLYQKTGGPLGKLKGKKHTKKLQQAYRAMTDSLLKTFCSTGATGRFVLQWTNTMRAACGNDKTMARILHRQPEPLVELRRLAKTAALAAEQSNTTTGFLVWWAAFESLTQLLVRAITCFGPGTVLRFSKQAQIDLSTADGKAVKEYYWRVVEPMLWKSIEEGNVTEKMCSMECAGDAMLLLGLDVSKHFIKSEKWDVLESFCQDNPAEPLPVPMTPRQREQFQRSSKGLYRNTIQLLQKLASRGMMLEDDTSKVVVGSLVQKLISRGMIGVLAKAALSTDEGTALAAVDGLAQLSRVRDCRLYLLQAPYGAALIRQVLQSRNLAKLSAAMLLLAHLLWDSEWKEPLSQMDHPKLEDAIVQCAAGAMRLILQAADSSRVQAKDAQSSLMQAYVKALQEEGEEAATAQIKKIGKAHNAWKHLETEDRFYEPNNCLLARSMIALCSACHVLDPARWNAVKALDLVACCIDAPAPDIRGSSVGYIHNAMNVSSGGVFLPSEFFDPLHIVVSLVRRVGVMADEQESASEQSMIWMQTTCDFFREPSWKPFFQQASEIDEDLQFTISNILPMLSGTFGRRPGNSIRSEAAGSEGAAKGSFGLHQSCLDLTGKLKRCYCCGKIESKRDDENLKECARCRVAVYCSRDCQVRHWKEHKKQCKKGLKKNAKKD